MKKARIYLLGIITLIAFPIVGWLLYYYLGEGDWRTFLQLDRFRIIPVSYGLELGFVYAIIVLLFLKAPIFEKLPLQFDKIIDSMKLNYFDALFLSLCAGIGEEILFRMGVQPILGPFLTAIVFVAIHGYIGIREPKMSYYGALIFPLTLILAYGYIEFGLWFSISAHFMYDLVIFSSYISIKPSES